MEHLVNSVLQKIIIFMCDLVFLLFLVKYGQQYENNDFNSKSDRKIGQREGANVVTEEDSDDSGDVLFVGENCLNNWYLDSGASFHTTSNRGSLGKYRWGKFGKVYLANGEAVDIVGMGEVKIRTPNGCVWTLNKVRHVPKLKKNLISVGSLDEEGYSTLFGEGTWKVTRGSLVIGD